MVTPKRQLTVGLLSLRSPPKPRRVTLASDWWPESATPNQQVLDALEEGREPPGNMMLTSFQNAVKYRELAATHKITKPYALILHDVPDDTDHAQHATTKKWCKLVGTWKELHVLPLATEVPMWPSQPKVVEATEDKVPAVALTTLRVLFPKRFLTTAAWAEALKRPQALVGAVLPANINFRTYGWHQNCEVKEEAVIGFVKLPSHKADFAVANSGLQRAFFQKVQQSTEPRTPVPIKWVPFNHDCQASYMQEAKRLAKVAKVGLAIRRGGKACLGLLGIQDENADGRLRKRWVAKGVPHEWCPQTFQDVLIKHNWRLLTDVLAPKHKRGIWTFRAVAPEGAGPGCVIQLKDQRPLMVSPWTPQRQPKPQVTPLEHVRKGWMSTAAPSPAKAQMPVEVSSQPANAPTAEESQLDSPLGLGHAPGTYSGWKETRSHFVPPQSNFAKQETSGACSGGCSPYDSRTRWSRYLELRWRWRLWLQGGSCSVSRTQ